MTNLPAHNTEPFSNPLAPPMPQKAQERIQWGRLYGMGNAVAIASAAKAFPGITLVIADDAQGAARVEDGLRFFLKDEGISILSFPDWETLPYDVFSPLPELVSQRLLTLYQLEKTQQAVLIVPVGTLLQRLPPKTYIHANTLVLNLGDTLSLDSMRLQLEQAGYQCVSQVVEHGEFTIRGSLLDIFPMGSNIPYRIDLFDEEIESIRTFDPETQLTIERVEGIRMLPAREYPLNEAGIAQFRQAFRNTFEGDPQRSLIYSEVSSGRAPGGLEYYLPLFFEQTATLFDFLPEQLLTIRTDETHDRAEQFLNQVSERYEQRRYDIERPLLSPGNLYLEPERLINQLNQGQSIRIQRSEIESRSKGYSSYHNFSSKQPRPLSFQARSEHPAAALQQFIAAEPGKILFIAESAGRREMLKETLASYGIRPKLIAGWQEFIDSDQNLLLSVAPLEEGVWFDQQRLVVIPESQLLGERVRQERRRKAKQRDADQIVRNLTELHIGAPVVHEDHGVGRYLGLQVLEVGGMTTEFLTLEYARGDKLYVPVSSLHLISRYAGASAETAPLHRLGGDQWERVKRKAAERACDVAAELLEIYARRAAHKGYAFPEPAEEYASFAASFDFEETPDQLQTINAVVTDMTSAHPMDRVVCGDVGFGKTEVAMRAAFM
ncbi:MAG: transcription-repair coupling factor, partial [Sedimenticola sp.]|nr:transcription-repair coupling factor [Sedimenticola sp.]